MSSFGSSLYITSPQAPAGAPVYMSAVLPPPSPLPQRLCFEDMLAAGGAGGVVLRGGMARITL